MEGYRLQSYQAGAPVLEEGTDDEASTMEGGRSRRIRPSRDNPSRRYAVGHSMVVACYEKPWLRRGSKWLLIVACAAVVGLVLFALIISLADGPAPDHGATVPSWARWEVVCLGVGGGLDQSDLPGGFLLRAIESGGGASSVTYVSLDAGTALFGLQRALQSSRAPRRASPSAGPKLTAAGAVYRDSIQSYLISHGHLDHTAGLVVGSPDDAYATPRKVVAGTNYTIDTLQNHVFNWERRRCAHRALQPGHPARGPGEQPDRASARRTSVSAEPRQDGRWLHLLLHRLSPADR